VGAPYKSHQQNLIRPENPRVSVGSLWKPGNVMFHSALWSIMKPSEPQDPRVIFFLARAFWPNNIWFRAAEKDQQWSLLLSISSSLLRKFAIHYAVSRAPRRAGSAASTKPIRWMQSQIGIGGGRMEVGRHRARVAPPTPRGEQLFVVRNEELPTNEWMHE